MTAADKLNQAKITLNNGHIHEAIALLDTLHVEVHAEALLHIKTHLALASAHSKDGNFRRAAFEILAIPFAGPASLAHKYLGLSRKL